MWPSTFHHHLERKNLSVLANKAILTSKIELQSYYRIVNLRETPLWRMSFGRILFRTPMETKHDRIQKDEAQQEFFVGKRERRERERERSEQP